MYRDLAHMSSHILYLDNALHFLDHFKMHKPAFMLIDNRMQLNIIQYVQCKYTDFMRFICILVIFSFLLFEQMMFLGLILTIRPCTFQ